ncbi:MAG: PQQ-dependent sugar dehydrogenase [Chitinophagaceae bacterium]|nr:PQQ-dependent sugar dehydrogenase [Rubrivivax sp.]
MEWPPARANGARGGGQLKGLSMIRVLALSVVLSLQVFAAAAQPALKVATVASGLANPWGLAFLPDGRMLVTEKAGRLRVVSGSTVSAPMQGVPAVDAKNQGGLFDVLVAPDFATSRRVWLAYAEPGSGDEAGKNGLAVGTAVLNAEATALTQWQVIYRQSPKVTSSGHFGGRLLLRGDGTMFVLQGDRMVNSERGKAQDLTQGHGKVMRLKLDGSPAADNPLAARPGAQPGIWSYGHRNIQGAALHPTTGELWLSEHGPQGGDEINRVLPGKNYGWPLVSFGCEYGAPIGRCPTVGGATTGEGFEPPLTTWVPTSIAPSGMVFYTGNRYPEWRGNLFSGALAGRALWRMEVTGNTISAREELLKDLGERIRDVRQGPDGWLYLLTDNKEGRVLRLER